MRARGIWRGGRETVLDRQFFTNPIFYTAGTFGTKVEVVPTIRADALMNAAQIDTRADCQVLVGQARFARNAASTFGTSLVNRAIRGYALMNAVLRTALVNGQVNDTRGIRDARFTRHAASAFRASVAVAFCAGTLRCTAETVRHRRFAGLEREVVTNSVSVGQTTRLGGRAGVAHDHTEKTTGVMVGGITEGRNRIPARSVVLAASGAGA